MKRVMPFLLGVLVLSSPVAQAAERDGPQLRLLPGNLWNNTGEVSPMEPGNILSHTHAEQGVVLWRHNTTFVTALVQADIDLDSEGYDWNNKRQYTGGVRLTKVHSHGWLRLHAGYQYERRNTSGLENSGPVGSFETWTAWHSYAKPGGVRMFDGFPGNAYTLAGNVSAVEPGNVLGVVDVQQGVALVSFGRTRLIPYVEVSAMGDTDGLDWGNRRTASAGAKLVVPLFWGGTLESGVARKYEYRTVTESSATANVWYASVGFGWSPPIGRVR